MKKILKITIALIFISLQVNCQNPKDTLYLKNGSVVFGKLNKKSKTEYRIQTPDGLLFSFSPDEVERYIQATVPVTNMTRERQTKGLSFIMESGIPVSFSDDYFPIHFSFTPMIDYSIDLVHSFSAGTGVEYWEHLMMPLFAEYRVSLSRENIAPFMNFRIGGLIHLKSDEGDEYYTTEYKNGWTFATGFGLLWPLGNIESYVKLGYRYAYARYTETWTNTSPPYNIFDHKQNFNCVEIKWGFKF